MRVSEGLLRSGNIDDRGAAGADINPMLQSLGVRSAASQSFCGLPLFPTPSGGSLPTFCASLPPYVHQLIASVVAVPERLAPFTETRRHLHKPPQPPLKCSDRAESARKPPKQESALQMPQGNATHDLNAFTRERVPPSLPTVTITLRKTFNN